MFQGDYLFDEGSDSDLGDELQEEIEDDEEEEEEEEEDNVEVVVVEEEIARDPTIPIKGYRMSLYAKSQILEMFEIEKADNWSDIEKKNWIDSKLSYSSVISNPMVFGYINKNHILRLHS